MHIFSVLGQSVPPPHSAEGALDTVYSEDCGVETGQIGPSEQVVFVTINSAEYSPIQMLPR